MASALGAARRSGRDLLAVAGAGGQDLVGRLHLYIGLGVLVPLRDPLVDVLFQRLHTRVGAALDLLRGELADPRLDHVEP